METRLEVPQEEKRIVALVKHVFRRDPAAIGGAFKGELLSGGMGFTATVLGIKYRVLVVGDDVEVFFMDPLERRVDAQKLMTYMLNTLERVLAGKKLVSRGLFVGMKQMKGGSSAHLYERRMSNYLAVELDGSSILDVEKAVEALGGRMLNHPTATWCFEVNPLNGFRMAIVFWQGEEGVPSGASILFGEEAIEADIPIEEIIAVAEMIVDRFVAFYRKESGREPRLFKSLYL